MPSAVYHTGMNRRRFIKSLAATGTAPCGHALAPTSDLWMPAYAASPLALETSDSEFHSKTRQQWQRELFAAFPKDDQAVAGGTVTMGATEDIETVNLLLAGHPMTHVVMGLVQEGLVRTSPIDGSFVPALADRWDIAEDHKTYTCHLARRALWHDGEPFTAEDVVFSFDARSNPETASPYTGRFNSVVDSYRMLDPYTVEVTATDVFAPVYFLARSFCPIVPKHIWQGVPLADWNENPGSTGDDPTRVVGTGPFRFRSWTPGERIELARNAAYFDDAPFIDGFRVRLFPDDASAVNALRAGEIDLIQNVPPDVSRALAEDENIDVAVYDTYDFTWYGYNLDRERTRLFQDRDVRQALFYALDRNHMVDAFMEGYARVANGTQPELSSAYAPARMETIYRADVDKGRELLADAGWKDEDGDGIVEKEDMRLAFEIMYAEGGGVADHVAAYMRDAWRAVGADATPKAVDFSSVLVPALTENTDFDICLLGYNWDNTGDQTALFASDQYKVGYNAMKYSNPEYDDAARAANREVDPVKRRELLIQASNIVNEDLPVGILWFRQDRTAYSTRLRNFVPNDLGGHLWSLPYAWVAQ